MADHPVHATTVGSAEEWTVSAMLNMTWRHATSQHFSSLNGYPGKESPAPVSKASNAPVRPTKNFNSSYGVDFNRLTCRFFNPKVFFHFSETERP